MTLGPPRGVTSSGPIFYRALSRWVAGRGAFVQGFSKREGVRSSRLPLEPKRQRRELTAFAVTDRTLVRSMRGHIEWPDFLSGRIEMGCGAFVQGFSIHRAKMRGTRTDRTLVRSMRGHIEWPDLSSGLIEMGCGTFVHGFSINRAKMRGTRTDRKSLS
jgi:hypothetical protein